MLQSHYRSPVDYSENSLAEARSGLIRCYRTLQLLKEVQGKSILRHEAGCAKKFSTRRKLLQHQFKDLADKFDAAMDDDFNTAQALGHVFDMVRLTNNFIADEKNMPASNKTEILAEAKKVI